MQNIKNDGRLKGAYSLSQRARNALHKLTQDPNVLYSVFAQEAREKIKTQKEAIRKKINAQLAKEAKLATLEAKL
jgi:hypothetical protein